MIGGFERAGLGGEIRRLRQAEQMPIAAIARWLRIARDTVKALGRSVVGWA
jgi:DNA-binding transcriptional regulator YiaG